LEKISIAGFGEIVESTLAIERKNWVFIQQIESENITTQLTLPIA